ncbi:MAG TPA: hypothetical protein PLJ42_05785 [Chitinophagales bacterium]|jgi:hypothetical protein|nr:hypothetical protein [Chitinophagales bacterium]MBP6154180.1 hypothetical protein [Chitinophagales bacterium]HQV78685.1 hypothetical protein [Chitinophagales bacterium]HQW78929.1 hypothetical protein [Chitinophagales bacterium]HRB18788.1 hypothetical protein [Chitinophagales bacterium]
MNKFDYTLELNNNEIQKKGVSSADVFATFEAIAWNDEYNKCLENEDYYGPWFSVSYTDDDALTYELEIEFYLFDDDGNRYNTLHYYLSFTHQNFQKEKIFFGLFGEKNIVVNNFNFLDNQKMEVVKRCLNAFLHRDMQYLKNTINEHYI